MKTKKIFTYFLIAILVVMISLSLVGCKEEIPPVVPDVLPDDLPPPAVEPKDIVVSLAVDMSKCNVQGVNINELSNIDLKVGYKTLAAEVISVDITMFSESDLEKLYEIGAHKVTIYFGEKGVGVTIKIREASDKFLKFKTFSDSYYPDIKVSEGKISLPSPRRANYTFIGWYTNRSYTVLFTAETVVKRSMTLYAYYTPNASDLGWVTNGNLIANLADNYYNDLTKSQKELLRLSSAGFLPTVGNVNLLVIPIEFSDIKHEAHQSKEFIKNKFFGTSLTNEFSVKEYYGKSSYNKLNISGEVLDWVSVSGSRKSYSSGNIISEASRMLSEAINNAQNRVEWQKYDNDKDGYLDGVVFLTAGSGKEGSFSTDIYHAYTFPIQSVYAKIIEGLTGKKIGYSLSTSISYIENDSSYGIEVVTHELGHMMGVSDLYDTDKKSFGDINKNGIASLDMMDKNLGDHNPINKWLFGWAKPKFVNYGTNDYDILPFVKEDEFLLIMDKKNVFSEGYAVIQYQKSSVNTYVNDSNKAEILNDNIAIYYYDLSLKVKDGVVVDFLSNNSNTPNKHIAFVEKDCEDSDTKIDATDLFYKGDVWVNSHINHASYFENIQTSVEVVDLNSQGAKLKIKMAYDATGPSVVKIESYTFVKTKITFNEILCIDERAINKILVETKTGIQECKIEYSKDLRDGKYIIIDIKIEDVISINFNNTIADRSGNQAQPFQRFA